MFRKLEIWQNAIILIKEIYKIVDLLPKSEEYNLKNQLRRAVVSVALNIAEGKCRATAKEFSKFLNTASASLYEVDAILVICNELGYIDNAEETLDKTKILNKKINSLRNKLMEIENV